MGNGRDGGLGGFSVGEISQTTINLGVIKNFKLDP